MFSIERGEIFFDDLNNDKSLLNIKKNEKRMKHLWKYTQLEINYVLSLKFRR